MSDGEEDDKDTEKEDPRWKSDSAVDPGKDVECSEDAELESARVLRVVVVQEENVVQRQRLREIDNR